MIRAAVRKPTAKFFLKPMITPFDGRGCFERIFSTLRAGSRWFRRALASACQSLGLSEGWRDESCDAWLHASPLPSPAVHRMTHVPQRGAGISRVSSPPSIAAYVRNGHGTSSTAFSFACELHHRRLPHHA